MSQVSGNTGGWFSPNSRLWLITFGDLLTLLLAFFIMLVALGPLSPNYQEPEEALSIGEERKIPSRGDPADTLSRAGTGIAKIDRGEAEAEFELLVGDFDVSTHAVSEEAAKLLDRLVKSVDYTAYHFLIESCLETAGTDEGLAWTGSMRRALAVSGQLIDAGLSENQVTIRVHGSHCSLIGGENLNGSSAAIVRITR